MSFGGVRDPHDPSLDTYSPLEAAAVQYAVSKGVLVVAAVGNADSAPTEPWGYAGYPAALPHVLGVSALNRDGTVPNFSNRDSRYVDIAAPGEEIFSTLPCALTASTARGVSRRGTRTADRWSSGAVRGRRSRRRRSRPRPPSCFATDPAAQADQVANILTRTAARLRPRHGLRALLHGARLADRLGPARHRRRRSSARERSCPTRIATRQTTAHPPPQRSGAARASESRRRSTTGTIATTSTRSRSAAGRRSSSPCAARRG